MLVTSLTLSSNIWGKYLLIMLVNGGIEKSNTTVMLTILILW